MTDLSRNASSGGGHSQGGRTADERARTALVRVSRLLASGSGVSLGDVLRAVGEALGAESVFFAAAPASPPPGAPSVEEFPPLPLAPTHLHGRVTTWTRADDSIGVTEPPDDSARGSVSELPPGGTGDLAVPNPKTDETVGGVPPIAVPLIADDGRFAGFLGVEGEGIGTELSTGLDDPLASVGHVLGAHLGRLAAEEALDQSEERWRQLVDRHPDSMLVVRGGVVGYANTAAASLLGVGDASSLVGRPFDDFVSAEDAATIRSAQELQLRVNEAGPFEHNVIRADGAVRHVESLSVPFPGADAGYQLVLRDLTERVSSEERYRTFVQTITEGVWRIRFDAPLSRGAPPRVLTNQILSQGRFAELNPAMVDILDAVSRPSPAFLGDEVGAAPLRTVLGPLGRVLARVFVEGGLELRSHEVSVRRPGEDPAYLSVNAVPRFENDALTEVWGSCTDITGRVEMERAMVAVLEDQQERIGRDLHDSVGQLLTGVRMLAEGLSEAVSGTGLADTASRIAAYSGEALDRVREICHGLVPPQLYSEGAAGALAELVEHVDALGHTRCLFRHEGGADIDDPDTALQVYRVVQEALSNALRHAGAEVVWVYLGRDGADIVVEVEDDGVGFTVGADRSRSIGLYGMSRRANSVGAMLAVETEPGAGTTVRLTLPGAVRRDNPEGG